MEGKSADTVVLTFNKVGQGEEDLKMENEPHIEHFPYSRASRL